MARYIVNPPIERDEDYYRHDQEIAEAILNRTAYLVVGMRRSGKTSFLWRIGRQVRRGQQPCLFFDLSALYHGGTTDQAVQAINAQAEAVVLLDEAELLGREWPQSEPVRDLLQACRNRTVVMTCGPSFFAQLDDGSAPEHIQDFAEPLVRHHLRPLTTDEARELIEQKNNPQPSSLEQQDRQRILKLDEREPLILQALCKEAQDGTKLRISLAGLGLRILRDLKEAMETAMVAAAYGMPVPDPQSYDVELLITLGALHRKNKGVAMASTVLSELICQVRDPPHHSEMPDDLISLPEAIAVSGTSRATILRRIGDGTLNSYRSPRAPKTSPHWLSRAEVTRQFPRGKRQR